MDHYNTSSINFNNSTTTIINEILKIAIPCSYEISNDHIPCVGFSPIISTCLCRTIDRRYVKKDITFMTFHQSSITLVTNKTYEIKYNLFVDYLVDKLFQFKTKQFEASNIVHQ